VWLALATIIGCLDVVYKTPQLAGMRFGRLRPLLVLFDLVQYQLREQFLPLLGYLLQLFDRFLKGVCHTFKYST